MRPDTGGGGADLELVFDRLNQGLVRVDADLRVVSANSSARRHFHPARIQLGMLLPEPWPNVSLAAIVGQLFDRRDFLRQRQSVPSVIVDARGPGNTTFRITGFPPGSESYALLHVEDRSVTERGRAEREFVANAAHELLTPLTGIVTTAFALEAGAKEVPHERDRFIAHIASQADRLARSARALLLLARAQSGQEPPRPESVVLRPLLENAIAATNSDHDSEVELDCAPELEVFVDRELAEQAFTNLVANAGRHARQAAVVVHAGTIDRNEVRVDVRDGGEGTTAERLEHFGERFYTSGGRDGGGFGLGVSIAAQAIELIGGTLAYDSVPGEGTRARVRLPSGRLTAA
jgi:signal transduction histidine kinase